MIGDRYEVRGFLGRGGNATAYRVFDRELRREIALKLLHPERETPSALARLRREIQVARDATSPRLVRIFDIGTSSQGTYLTMELVDGSSLREILRRGPLPVEEAIRIAIQLFEGLAALHELAIVHRDVKPENLLLAGGHEAKLADFGLARRLDREETQLTRAEGVVGTLNYLSPEQALGKEARQESDLYAAGLVLFEMLAGKLPHEVASELGRHLGPLQGAPNVRTFRPEVPRWLARLVARLLEVKPKDRYPSAREVLQDLTRRQGPSVIRFGSRAYLGALLALLLMSQIGIAAREAPRVTFSHLVRAGETSIAAVSTNGEKMWTINGVDPDIVDRAVLARIKPGEPRLIAVVLARPQEWSPESISTLSFLDPANGEILKRVKLPSGASYFPNDPPRFWFASAKAVDLLHDGVDEVLVNYNHVPEAPFYTVLYDPRFDQAQVVYYSRGGQDFQEAADLDGDGALELLFAGVNNGWNWVNTVAAVRLDPEALSRGRLYDEEAAAAPDTLEQLAQQRHLLWYATVPRGYLKNPVRLTVDEERRKITVHYLSGKTWTLGFDGFPPGPSTLKGEDRQTARRTAYDHLWEADRLTRAGNLDLAMAEAQAAFNSAQKAHVTWLSQYAERIQAKILVAQGRVEQAEARFVSLMERVEDAPEVAYDAGVSFHLHGDLSRAVAWYERGIGLKSAIGAGKSKHEFLKGEVLALVERKRYAEALEAVDRFGATYPSFHRHTWLFREYVRWRAGERPAMETAEVPWNFTDLEHYWALEFALATGAEPKTTLQRVDRFLAERPETRAELLSLRAELLNRLGHENEAAEAAQSALELARVEAGRNIIARGHLDLLSERVRRLRPVRSALP